MPKSAAESEREKVSFAVDWREETIPECASIVWSPTRRIQDSPFDERTENSCLLKTLSAF